jgi:hypothetical protein
MSRVIHERPNPQVIQLPKPAVNGATSVFTALARRKTTREISNSRLPIQELSNLLWAACGVNRPTGPFGIPGRTAASASNSQEIDLSVPRVRGTPAETGERRSQSLFCPVFVQLLA